MRVTSQKPNKPNVTLPRRHCCWSAMFFKQWTSSMLRLQYKYSKLAMNSSGKECELPAADSCAIMEGEDAEDDLIYLTKKSFFNKIHKSFSREVSKPPITHNKLTRH